MELPFGGIIIHYERTEFSMNAKTEPTNALRLKLIEEMRSGRFAQCKRLPRETVLSEQYGISRTHLRDILAQLEREGFITRRHGVGTVINRHVLQVRNRMDIEAEFLEIIRNNGYDPAVSQVTIHEECADDTVASKLQIPAGAEVIRLCRVCTADGRPALYCEDVVDKGRVLKPYMGADLGNSIFWFLQEFCDVDAYMDLTNLSAVLADEKLAAILDVSPGTPLLYMDEVDYDIDGNVVFYSSQYFVNEMFEHTVLRKKL